METREFVLGTWRQYEWQWLVMVALFLTGSGSGLFLLSLIAGFALGMAVGVAVVVTGCLFLLADLSRPQTAWRLIARPRTSWMSRGVVGITAFCVLGVLQVASLTVQQNGW